MNIWPLFALTCTGRRGIALGPAAGIATPFFVEVLALTKASPPTSCRF